MRVSCNDTQQTQNSYVKMLYAIISLLFLKNRTTKYDEILLSIPQSYAILLVLF
jgi:hypothetical protein